MELCIEQVAGWFPNHEEFNLGTDEVFLNHQFTDFSWPKLDFVPPLQRRRLSPFAKIALYTAEQVLQKSKKVIPIVFSSRHGDIHKSSLLLEALANEEDISPTAFSLSVHNAIPGLYSILTNNKNAINAISAGKDSFFMALTDAYARLKSGQSTQVLLLHTDQDLPERYMQFKDELQIPHAIALLLTLSKSGSSDNLYTFDFKSINTQLNISTEELPAALSFYCWVNSNENEFNYSSDNYHWYVNKYVS